MKMTVQCEKMTFIYSTQRFFFSTMELFKVVFFFFVNCSHGKHFRTFCTPASSISFV